MLQAARATFLMIVLRSEEIEILEVDVALPPMLARGLKIGQATRVRGVTLERVL